MTTTRELLAGFSDPSIAFARELGRVAKSRSAAHGGEVQPVPEMFAEGSSELREWRREYGHDGREATWHRLNQRPVEVAVGIHTEVSSTSGSAVGFVLDAEPKKSKTTKRPISGTSNRSTKSQSSSRSTAAIPEPAAQHEIDRLLKIGLTQQEADELVVGKNWNCESLVCAVELKTTDGIPPRVVGLLRENWRIL